jgi:tyrosyl-tRNA synthetase
MKKDFLEEMKWRGMIHDMTPGIEEVLKNAPVTGYIGFDPTADSLHIGHLVQIMTLVHFQQCGHKPIALVGGATGMVGDPSGKSEERNLLDEKTIQHNLEGIKEQLSKFLDFNAKENPAEIVNNYDWFKNMTFLEFIRDVGKHITVNYMLAKDSVKKRLETGMSFTEFTYQLVQGYDFYRLYKDKNCLIQMGGSDQWGNIVTGTELIRRIDGGTAYAVTTPLLKKADGTKFGKTAGGSVWLDKKRTSPYKFYQYWINTSDEDAANYIKIFTLKSKDEIDKIITEHNEAPHLRLLQKELAKDITIRVHGEEEYIQAVKASEILFGKSNKNELAQLDENTFLDIFEGVPHAELPFSEFEKGISIIELLASKTNFLKSNAEARRAIKENSISINKEKVNGEITIDTDFLINNKYLLLQRGKKNYFLIKVK